MHDEHNGSMVLIALLAVFWPALAPVLAALTVVAFVVLGLVVWRVLIPRARTGHGRAGGRMGRRPN